MVRQINLSKNNNFDLTKPNNNFDLTKPPVNNLGNKPPLSLPGGLGNKPPVNLPDTTWDINLTDPVEGMDKISIPLLPFDIYYTPDEVVDPQDCGRYPNSPYCGGIPFSILPIGFEPEIVIDQCNIGISIQPVLFFIKLPQQQIVFRAKDCQPNKPPEPPPPTTPDTVTLPPPPPGCYYDVWWAVNVHNSGTADQIYQPPETYTYGADNINLSDPAGYVEHYSSRNGVLSFSSGRARYNQTAFAFKADDSPYRGGLDFGGILLGRYDGSGFNSEEYEGYDAASSTYYGFLSSVSRQTRLVNGASWDGVCPPVKWYGDNRSFESPLYAYVTHKLVCSTPQASDYTQINPPPPPLLLPPPKLLPPEDMNCCPQITALLQYLILRVGELDTKLTKTNACLGVEEFPALLPKSLISKDEGFIGNFLSGLNDQVEVPNLTKLVTQFIKYFDEVAGQWEIPIEVKDSDPLTPGEQPVGIKLPNIAEYAAESFLLQFRGAIDQATMLNMMTRILVEVGQIKQQDYRAYGLLQTLTDYLGFDYSEAEKELPLSFDPSKESFDELLKEVVLKVPYPQYTEKHDFRTDLRRIMEAVSIIKAVHWKKLEGGNTAEGMKTQIIKTIKDRAKQIKDEAEKNSDDFDTFIKDVEDGFPTTPDIPDPTQPYGKPYAQRPEVKKLKET